MYTYFTKEEIEAIISKAEGCGAVVVDLKPDDETIPVKTSSSGVFQPRTADEIARILSPNNPDAVGYVDCSEGMMVFDKEFDKKYYILGHL